MFVGTIMPRRARTSRCQFNRDFALGACAQILSVTRPSDNSNQFRELIRFRQNRRSTFSKQAVLTPAAPAGHRNDIIDPRVLNPRASPSCSLKTLGTSEYRRPKRTGTLGVSVAAIWGGAVRRRSRRRRGGVCAKLSKGQDRDSSS